MICLWYSRGMPSALTEKLEFFNYDLSFKEIYADEN